MPHLDFETYSAISLPDVGAYRYAEDKSTEPLALCWAGAKGRPSRWQPHQDGYTIPNSLRKAAEDPDELFWAHNAEFERCIWNGVLVKRHGWPVVPRHRWRCTAVLAAAANLPRSLDAATTAARTTHRKNPEGKKLMRRFCGPRKPTKANPATRIYPNDDPEAFERFVVYCEDDVEAERELHRVLPPLPEWEWENYTSTCAMNDIGLPLDMQLLQQATKIVTTLEHRIHTRTEELTGGLRATQRDKMMAWFEDNGAMLNNMQAATVRDMWHKSRSGGTINLSPQARELLELRIEASRASTKKLVSMLASVCGDGRAHGMYMHYGAHTGRDAGKIIQPQNYKRGFNDARRMAIVLEVLRRGDPDLYALLYDQPMETLSMVIRGFIAAKDGHVLLVIDYGQIEARLLDWHAGNEAGLVEWRTGVDKYVRMAARIFQIPESEVTDEQRRVGKNTTLGCGFGLAGPGFLISCRNNGIEIDQDLADVAVNTWRTVNELDVEYWSDVEQYAKAAIEDPDMEFELRHCKFAMADHALTITLPSGRVMRYPHAKIKRHTTKYGKVKRSISFQGMYGETFTHGAKVVENIVQASARDILFHGCRNAVTKDKFHLVGRSHDEGIFEERKGERDIKRLEALVCELPPEYKGCPIVAKGFESPFYRKG